MLLSTFERRLLIDHFKVPEQLLYLSQFHYPDLTHPSSSLTSPTFQDRDHFVFIGNFRHSPNFDAVSWLKKSIWPLIRKELPEAQAHIYGAYPSKEMMDLTAKEMGFHVLGHTPDQYITLQKYRINLAPLRFGAGIKGKISDAWWCGTPTLSTQIGFEGMADDYNLQAYTGQSPEDFALKAVELYKDETMWKEAQSLGFRILQAHYSKKITYVGIQ